MLSDFVVDNEVQQRVDYYCKDHTYPRLLSAVEIEHFKKDKSFAYYADTKKIVKFFPKKLRFSYVFGDVIHVPAEPSFVKSRPILADNHASVLLKLNAIRHYNFLEDKKAFRNKKSQAVWRGMIYQKHRKILTDKFATHPLCDVGHSDESLKTDVGFKGFLSIEQQLDYKYIISVEGKDVATNLKWIMSSNSLCFMRRPRFETWYMEGRLIPNVHYVLLDDDFSDLEEKIQYYNDHPELAEAIIKNAQAYTEQFKNIEREHKINLLVAKKYFELSGQL
ncbi:glycosyl transferase family 90 [Marinomonas sp. 15G1-11]|uniref:Glycosyl transferase family 90 n=1 Tax=Marinomonas phaeophyticola TaxID=3004091 RepID=A0ABT4JY46_9GAMM|nr:glycosyl transferase family 90 [Marinomonas sp. 15G1-11]MCZ2723259.1 glycosyl transferase family 90 [Marinomonas sp. 15G1-11]